MKVVFAAMAALLPVPAASAQDVGGGSPASSATSVEASIDLRGPGIEAMVLDRRSLAAMPTVERDVSFMTSKGLRRGRYEGVLLRTVLERAGLWRSAERSAELRRTLHVTGRDGYTVAFSVGEIAPDFGDAPITIALTVDGAPLPAEEGLRLVVPGDKRGARAVYDIARMEVR